MATKKDNDSKEKGVTTATPSDILPMLRETVNAGTEEVTQEDLNTPSLKLIQATTKDILGKTDGWYYRNDTKQQIDVVDVNLVYVTTIEGDNFNNSGVEKKKIYFGFYDETNEPFKFYVRGWGLSEHRKFQTEVLSLKNKYRIPMFSLKVKLSSELQSGTKVENGKSLDYQVYKPVFTILKNPENGKPMVEQNPDRIEFLFNSIGKFKVVAMAKESENDEEVNEVPQVQEDQQPQDEAVTAQTNDKFDENISPDDIPF